MFYPFLVADPRTGLQYRLTDTGLAELSLAPVSTEWAPGWAIVDAPDPVWRESVANAPVETISAVSVALGDLVLATDDLRVPVAGSLQDGRARRHLDASIGLWRRLGDALPEGLAPVRHVLELPHGNSLIRCPWSRDRSTRLHLPRCGLCMRAWNKSLAQSPRPPKALPLRLEAG